MTVRDAAPYLLIISTVVLPLVSGQQSADPVFEVETRLLEVEVRVRAPDGKPLAGLKEEDFTLLENGTPQKIATFEESNRGPGEPAASGEAIRQHGPNVSEAERTWIYIASEATHSDFLLVYRALREFLDTYSDPTFFVSLGGLPFTNDQEQLGKVLEAMRQHPMGREAREGAGPIPPLVDQVAVRLEELENERKDTILQFTGKSSAQPIQAMIKQKSDIVRGQPPGADKKDIPNPYLLEQTLKPIDAQVAMHGQIALRRYTELAMGLSAYPGKKAVVLFRPGLRLEPQLIPALQQLASQALRSQVSFYTVDSRGLVGALGTDASLSGGLPIGREVGIQPSLTRGGLTAEERHLEQLGGLASLAVLTGGETLRNSNALVDVFDKLAEDSSHYYLLGYYPVESGREGRFREIQVSVAHSEARVETAQGYYGSRPFPEMTEGEKAVHLHHTLVEDEATTHFPIQLGYDCFRSPDGRAVLLFTARARLAGIAAEHTEQSEPPTYSLMARAVNRQSADFPLYHHGRTSFGLSAKELAAAQDDTSKWVVYSAEVTVPPGEYDWKVALQDDQTGRIGIRSIQIEVPDFSQPLAPSTLLLTTRAIPLKRAKRHRARKRSAAGSALLDFDKTSFLLDHRHQFGSGDTVYLLYDLYNVTPELLASPPPFEAILFWGGRQVAEVQGVGKAIADPKSRSIRYSAALDAKEMPPGRYTVRVSIPTPREPGRTSISRSFLVLIE